MAWVQRSATVSRKSPADDRNWAEFSIGLTVEAVDMSRDMSPH
eukprot:CAMPEP_0195100354 /NCGR_PEP_ID=MMETSP0448-20130528/62665_1 /TAXON_ID=66468 /ORGANISM="Heterocapsa triquestra, Strain CCMP 448" /LENGTH=42 /DNA_ID= /DNA_START= /DNA_END= /DNA_ORIENTATION=